MANIPIFESILAEIHQSVGINPIPKPSKLARLEFPLAKHREIVRQLTEELADAFGLDEDAQYDAMTNLLEWANFHTCVAQSCWTFEADLRQIVWFMAAYSYAPGLGRRMAFWTLHESMDADMPGGTFWYLPTQKEQNIHGQLTMPVAQVVDWLLDLLGQSIDQIAPGLGGGEGADARAKTAKVNAGTIERVLYQWRKGSIPRRDNIERYFAEDSALDFKGAFIVEPELDSHQAMQAALAFVQRKGLDAAQLRQQIPMTALGRLEAVLSGNASEDENNIFISLMLKRYGPPTMRTIRQRFLLARIFQDSYRRLGKFLLGEDFDESCADPCINKVLQLLAIFQTSYNLTIDAHKQCDSFAEEDAYFESKIPILDREGIFLSVLPSHRHDAWKILPQRLTHRFFELQPGQPLEDHVGYDIKSAAPIMVRNIARLKEEIELDQEIRRTLGRLRTGSPWRTLQNVKQFWAVSQIAQIDKLPLRIRKMATERMRELAANSKELMGTISIELGHILNNEDRAERPSDAKDRVAALLLEAKANPAFEIWRAVILQFEAKHHLASNDFVTARNLFDAALDASLERNMGTLRGDIARDAFALMVEFPPAGFSLKNCERYMRHMLTNGALEINPDMMPAPPALEDVAVASSSYFWETLYWPYHGETMEKRLCEPETKLLIADSLKMIFTGDWNGLRAWFKHNGKHFRDKRLRYVRGDSALMAWIKALDQIESKRSLLATMIPDDLKGELEKFENLLRNWHVAIGMMIETWPNLVNLEDFKAQSPLMLAADNGDLALVQKLLAAGAKTTQQDFEGRTALHAAIATRSLPCVQALLEHAPEMAGLCSKGSQSPFHTAVRVGHVGIVQALINLAPKWAGEKNEDGLTALELAEYVLADPQRLAALRNAMASEGRKTGNEQNFKDIVALLRAI